MSDLVDSGAELGPASVELAECWTIPGQIGRVARLGRLAKFGGGLVESAPNLAEHRWAKLGRIRAKSVELAHIVA